MIIRYQNLIRLHYWQKVVNKNQKVGIQNQNFITKNKGYYSVSEPHQILPLTKSRWQKQKVVTQNQNLIKKVITQNQNLIKVKKVP